VAIHGRDSPGKKGRDAASSGFHAWLAGRRAASPGLHEIHHTRPITRSSHHHFSCFLPHILAPSPPLASLLHRWQDRVPGATSLRCGDPVKNGVASPRAGQARARWCHGQLRRSPLLEILGASGRAAEGGQRGRPRQRDRHPWRFYPSTSTGLPMTMAERPAPVSSPSDLLRCGRRQETLGALAEVFDAADAVAATPGGRRCAGPMSSKRSDRPSP
jgi:hypothetical protein